MSKHNLCSSQSDKAEADTRTGAEMTSEELNVSSYRNTT